MASRRLARIARQHTQQKIGSVCLPGRNTRGDRTRWRYSPLSVGPKRAGITTPVGHKLDFFTKNWLPTMAQIPSLLYLSDKTLKSLDITTSEVVESIERLIRGQTQSEVWSAPKAAILPPDGRYMMASLSAADDPPFLAVKAVILNPRNPERGLPQINGLITLLDSGTGLPVAVMDANWVTAVRTAAASAVAAKRMARPESSIMAFIGCGVQAHSHLHAFADLFPLDEIRAFGRGSTNRDVLCKTARDMGFKGIASGTAKDALEGADIVVTSVTLTAQIDPFLDARWLKPGAFISSTDLAVPWIREGMSAFDRIIIDDRNQETAMPNPMVEPSLISGDLPELVNGDVEGRHSDEERTAFVFRAVVLGDLALAGLAYQKARAVSQGLLIET